MTGLGQASAWLAIFLLFLLDRRWGRGSSRLAMHSARRNFKSYSKLVHLKSCGGGAPRATAGFPKVIHHSPREFAMSKSRLIVGVSAIALTIGLATQGANAGEAKKTGPQKNIVQIAREAGSFKT